MISSAVKFSCAVFWYCVTRRACRAFFALVSLIGVATIRKKRRGIRSIRVREFHYGNVISRFIRLFVTVNVRTVRVRYLRSFARFVKKKKKKKPEHFHLVHTLPVDGSEKKNRNKRLREINTAFFVALRDSENSNFEHNAAVKRRCGAPVRLSTGAERIHQSPSDRDGLTWWRIWEGEKKRLGRSFDFWVQ